MRVDAALGEGSPPDFVIEVLAPGIKPGA